MLASLAIDWPLVWSRIVNPNGVFFHALWATVYISVVAQVLGILLGLLAALMRMSKFWPIRLVSSLYVLIFRGTPVIVQIMFLWLVLPLGRTVDLGVITLPNAVVAGILALGINEGAYMREITRAGIDSIDRGQMEAAKSLGMRTGLAMRRIVLPQAARVIVPPLGNEFNNMMKTSSLLNFIGVYELFADASQVESTTLKAGPFIAVAFWYLVLTSIWSVIQALIERKLAVSEHGDEISLRDRAVAIWTEGGGMVRSAWPWRARA
ncbi:MAG: amino acid ABC transporter permease [Gaiellaceae bacterium]|jgi:polar amino acid transport system permease protein